MWAGILLEEGIAGAIRLGAHPCLLEEFQQVEAAIHLLFPLPGWFIHRLPDDLRPPFLLAVGRDRAHNRLVALRVLLATE